MYTRAAAACSEWGGKRGAHNNIQLTTYILPCVNFPSVKCIMWENCNIEPIVFLNRTRLYIQRWSQCLKITQKSLIQNLKFTSWVDKNWWKMPQFKNSNATFWVIFKQCASWFVFSFFLSLLLFLLSLLHARRVQLITNPLDIANLLMMRGNHKLISVCQANPKYFIHSSFTLLSAWLWKGWNIASLCRVHQRIIMDVERD